MRVARTKGNVKYNGKRVNKALREVYEECCLEERVTPNSVLLDFLPEKPGVVLASSVLDLSRNYVGDRGLLPVVSVVMLCPHIEAASFSDNGLRNNAVKALSSAFSQHPGLTSLDLSDNYISAGGAAALMTLLQQNNRIKSLNLTNTKIDVDDRLKIKEMLAENSALAAAS
ncbi:putative serine/threonine-protein kinase roco5 [Diplonema papillatum]|nr:putative serine/threonine-protein kinase roco5 [Diplonema papillatum]